MSIVCVAVRRNTYIFKQLMVYGKQYEEKSFHPPIKNLNQLPQWINLMRSSVNPLLPVVTWVVTTGCGLDATTGERPMTAG